MKALRFLLYPFAVLYDGVTSLRNTLYNRNVFTSIKFEIPVIAVGNLSVGGTGKTPQIEYLIRLLKDEKKVAVLSRGYKRKTQGFILIDKTHSAEDVGDEPLQFFQKFDEISVAVDADRVHGIQKLQQLVNPDVILLDDAFQHRKVEAGFYMLLTKYNDLFVDDFVLPTGNLRESSRGAERADVIVVTKCPSDLSPEKKEKITKKLQTSPEQPVFFTQIVYTENTKGTHSISLHQLKEYEIVLITGIANPKPLLEFLNDKECSVQHLKFPDHHHFSQQEIQKIQQTFNNVNSSKKILLTTEKDYMRLHDQLPEVSYIEIESQFLSEKKQFDELILANVQ
jgi:tetraacyldisaccharide 4'-kinase